MRILFVDFNPINVAGGAEVWLSEVCARLSRTDSVSIVTLDRGPQNTDLSNAVRAAGVRLQEIKGLHPSSAIAPRDLALFSSLVKNSDLVYLVFCPGGIEWTTILTCWFKDVPLLVGHHQVLARPPDSTFPLSWRAYFSLFGFRGRRVAGLAQWHHVLNHETEKIVASVLGRAAFRIPNGVDVSTYKPSTKFDEFTVLFLGRLHAQKGSDRLPALIKATHRRFPQAQFVIAGPGELTQDLRELSSDPRVAFTGFVDDERKRHLLAASHCLVMPSRFETLGLSGMEALASGTPVVASDIPGPREFLKSGQNGFLAEGSDGLASAIGTLHHAWKTGDYGRYSKSARESILPYDWEKIIPTLRKAFAQVTMG